MNLDVFKGDGFSMSDLTKALIDRPFTPTRLGKLGLFTSEPISTTTIDIERDADSFVLVPSKPRGAPGTPVVGARRKLKQLRAVHLPQTVDVQADEVQNLRAFGSATETETALALLVRRMEKARRNVDLTMEWQRMGALKGQILDADGVTVITDLFAEFGVTQHVLPMGLDSDTTKVINKITSAKRMVEDELGFLTYTGLRAECSEEFFDALVSHPAVEDAYKFAATNNFLREDNRGGFIFGGVLWEEYRGKVGSTRFVGAGEAYLVPEGVPDLFVQNYAPANYNETVNTPGLPVYAKIKEADFEKGFDCEIQSNPLVWSSRPAAVVKLKMGST